MFTKVQDRPTPLIPPLVARLILKEGKRRQRGSEPGHRIAYKSLGGKWLKLRILGKHDFPQKYEKSIPIINNDAERTRKMEDGISSMQLFSCNQSQS